MVAPNKRTVTAFDAKNRLGRLLDRVQAGEQWVITRHGRPVARLVPVANEAIEQVEEALAAMAVVRESLKARGVAVSREEIRQWRDEGRR